MTAIEPALEKRLEGYVSLLLKWNNSINLIAESTRQSVWQRHIWDSLQLIDHLPESPGSLVDIGSGGGLPGIVIAAYFKDRPTQVTLVERDKRKSVFLNEVRRQLGLDCVIKNQDIKALEPLESDVITARAFAPLSSILPLLAKHLAPSAIALLPKGENWQTEVDAARREWHFNYEALPSATDAKAAILKVTNPRKIVDE